MPLRRAAVLGRPIAHSLSPVLHAGAYAALGLDWTYEAIDCGIAELPGVLAARSDWAGFSCTMPLKHAVLDVASTVTSLAAAVGSANTLLPGADGWIADNTDVAGILAALGEYAVAPDSVTILGAGGTAQAMLAALLTLSVDECAVLVRDRSRAAALLASAERLGVTVSLGALDASSDALAAGLVVSTLPAGAADPFAARRWLPTQAVLDVVYPPSALIAAAARGGARVIGGALVLLHQAAAQVALMTGQAAPVEEMRAALLAAGAL